MPKKVSSKFFKRGLAAGALSLVALGSNMQASQAAVLYDHINYSGEMGTWNTGSLPKWANDRASSIKKGKSRQMCENVGCYGRTAPLKHDYSDLRSLRTNLHLGETWSDRISALR